MKLKDISRTATFAWDPSSASEPLIVTGAVAGALDASFSNDSQLEIWAPKLYEREGADTQGYSLGGQDSGPKGSVTVSSRFNRLAWSQPEASASGRGIIAAGLETGEVCLYDPVKIFAGEESLIYKNDKHTGPVRGLHWNPLKKNLLLSGGVNAELYIHNLDSLGDPIPPGPVSTKLGEITSLAWNPSVASVFAASSSSGFTSIWDLRHSKEIAALQYGGGAAKGDHTSGRAGTQIGKRRGMSDLCWHPEQATRLVTASEDDESPIVMMWDLRNTRAPERILSGHTKGVLSVAWCKQDADLLASCGKDNRTLLWNPQSGEIVGELAPTTDWSFETAWCPSNPNLLAVASFDGHIGINSLQSTGAKEPEENNLAADATADDIFANLGSTSTSDDKTNAQSLTQAPKWMARPCSASWGYGGVLATVSNLPSASGKHQSSVVHLRHVVTEETIIERAKNLSEMAGDKDKLAEFCSSKAENPSWKALQSLFNASSRDELVALLGFSKEEVARQVEELVKTLVPTIVEEPPQESKGDTTPKSALSEAGDKTPEAKPAMNHLFAQDDRPITPADVGGDTDFFSSMAAGSLRNPHLDSLIPHLNQPTDSSVAATVGSSPSSVRSESIKDNVFRIYPAGESDTDRLITQALVLGDFSSAVNLCLASERYADALLLAVRGGPELLQSTQKAYFTRRTLAHPFLRVYQSIVTEDLADIVQNADLAEWKVAFVVLCTYAKEADFANLADQLGRRLQFKWQLLTGSDSPEAKAEAKKAREDATLCYLAARNLEHVVGIWISEMQEEEAATDAPRYSAHALALQSFIEKVSAFRAATGYVDKDLTATVPAEEAAARTYALAGLYDRFYEYADLLATQGLVDVAASYIKMTPKDYQGSDGHQFDKARSRVFTAAGISDNAAASTSSAFGRQPAAGPSTGATPSRHKPSASVSSRYPPAPTFSSYGSGPYGAQSSPYNQPSNPYGAPAAPARGPSPVVSSGPYAPPPTSGPYAPPPSSQPAGPYGPATTSSAPSNPYAPPPGAGGPSQFNAQPAYGANTFQPASAYGANSYDSQSQGYNPYGGSNYGAPAAPSAPPLGPPPRAGEHKDPIIPASQRRDMPGWNDAPSLSAAAKRGGSGSATSTPKPQPITSPFPMSEHSAPFAPPGPSSTPPPPRGPPGMIPPPPKGGPRPPSAAKNAPPQSPYSQPQPPSSLYGAPPQFPQSPPQQAQHALHAPHAPHAPQYAPPPKAGPPPPRGGPRAPPPGVLAGPPPRALSPLGPGNRAEQRPQPLGSFSPPPMAGPPPGARAGPPPPGRAGPRPPSHTPTPPASTPPKAAAYPPGDRAHMGPAEQAVYDSLSTEFARVKAANPGAAGTVKKVVDDTERRLNLLYDELNNGRVPADTVARLGQIAAAAKGGDAGGAMAMHTDMLTGATSELAHWAPGIKQLIRLGLTQG